MPIAICGIPPLTESDKKRFWSKVNKSGPTVRPELGQCWEWVAATSAGYGKFGLGGRAGGMFRANRIAYTLLVGPIPEGQLVLHKCDYRKCVRPDHLFLGDQMNNISDMWSKNRGAEGDSHGMRKHPERRSFGEKCGTSKLSTSDVLEMRRLHEASVSGADISLLFGVTKSTVSRIVHRLWWKHV